MARIRIGIGGWNYPPWRGVFYPEDLPQARELEFASRAVTAIEVNSTFYRLQTPAVFAKWAATVPDDFVFAIKASRFLSNRRNLREGEAGIVKFFAQGLAELGPKLGPVLWQLMPTKRFDADEIRDFLSMLPASVGGMPLRHALEARNDSFACREHLELLRSAGVANVFAESDEYPRMADVTADFTYARLRHAREHLQKGFQAKEIERWAEAAKQWCAGKGDVGLPLVGKPAPPGPRDVFLFVINGAKVRAPAAAQALLRKLDRPSP